MAGLSSLYVLKRINAMLRFLRQWNSLVVVTSFRFPPTNRGILVRRESRRIAVSLGAQRFLLPARVLMVQEAFPRKNQLVARPRRQESRGSGWSAASSVAVRPCGDIALAHAEARAFLAAHALPLYFPRLVVRSLGRVVTCWPSYHDSQFIWPVGYHAQRSFLSFRDPSQTVLYTCLIGDGGPEVHLTDSYYVGAPVPGDRRRYAWKTRDCAIGHRCLVARSEDAERAGGAHGPRTHQIRGQWS